MLSNGLQDNLKINNFKNNNDFNEKYIFDIKKSFTDAVLKLFKCNKKIDSIIVSNDLQAFRLIKLLDLIDSSWNEKLLLISYGNLALSHLAKPSISSGTLSFDVSSKEVIRIYETLMKNPHIHSIQTVVDSQILEKESTNKNNSKGIVFTNCHLPSTKTIKDINSIELINLLNEYIDPNKLLIYKDSQNL